MLSASFMSAFAVSQEEYDKAQEEAKAAREATEAKRKEAKEAAKKAAAAVANFEDAEKQLKQLDEAQYAAQGNTHGAQRQGLGVPDGFLGGCHRYLHFSFASPKENPAMMFRGKAGRL